MPGAGPRAVASGAERGVSVADVVGAAVATACAGAVSRSEPAAGAGTGSLEIGFLESPSLGSSLRGDVEPPIQTAATAAIVVTIPAAT